MKSIDNFIIERGPAPSVSYRVSFVDALDNQGLPISATIMVATENVKTFEDFAKKNQDSVFAHVEGGNIEY